MEGGQETRLGRRDGSRNSILVKAGTSVAAYDNNQHWRSLCVRSVCLHSVIMCAY